MIDLTDRQRFALRESLCDVLSEYSEEWSASSWDADAVDDAKSAIDGRLTQITVKMFRHIRGLVELLGEWPIGHRGEGGWEKLEGESCT
jgi:hypothetical protein